jgi:hypothetical protein
MKKLKRSGKRKAAFGLEDMLRNQDQENTASAASKDHL